MQILCGGAHLKLTINNPHLEFRKYISTHSEIVKHKKTSHHERESAESPAKILDIKLNLSDTVSKVSMFSMFKKWKKRFKVCLRSMTIEITKKI